MSDERNKEVALNILEGAMILFPPIASAIGKAIEKAMENASEDERPLLEEVLTRLPVDSASERVAKKLGG